MIYASSTCTCLNNGINDAIYLIGNVSTNQLSNSYLSIVYQYVAIFTAVLTVSFLFVSIIFILLNI